MGLGFCVGARANPKKSARFRRGWPSVDHSL